MSDSTLPREIRSIPVPERVYLAEPIWDSIVEDQQAFELTAAQRAELDPRVAAHDAAPNRGQPWEVVKQRLLRE